MSSNTRSMYDHYYTAVDVTVDLSCPTTNLRVNIDKTVAIAYTHNISSIPVYALGNALPGFFSTGNSLVQGQFDIAFKSTAYLRAAINYLVGGVAGKAEGLDEGEVTGKEDVLSMSNAQLRSYKDSLNNQNLTPSELSLISVPLLLDVIITFNNENSNMVGGSSSVTLEGVKFISQSTAVHSQDDNALVDRFTFYARNIK